MGFSGVIAGRSAVFVCKLARYDFAGERGYFCTDAFATGKHKQADDRLAQGNQCAEYDRPYEQQDCRKGRGN